MIMNNGLIFTCEAGRDSVPTRPHSRMETETLNRTICTVEENISGPFQERSALLSTQPHFISRQNLGTTSSRRQTFFGNNERTSCTTESCNHPLVFRLFRKCVAAASKPIQDQIILRQFSRNDVIASTFGAKSLVLILSKSVRYR